MTFHPERYIGVTFVLLVLTVVAPPVADWCRARLRLPAGYGAEGDRQQATRMPGAVRTAAEALAAGAEGSWVKECVEGGAWVYHLHVCRDGQESVIRLTPNGHVIPGTNRNPEAVPDGAAVEAGG